MCGEMAGEPQHTRLLLGLGLTEFSMHPSSLLEVKRIVRESDISALRATAQRLIETSDPDVARSVIEELAAA